MNFTSLSERNTFIEENIPLVISIVMRLNYQRFDDDLFQVGCLSLIQAVEKFDEGRGFRFSTYASACIMGSIRRYRGTDKVIRSIRRGSSYISPEVGSLDVEVNNKGFRLKDNIADLYRFEEHVVNTIFLSSVPLTSKERQVFKLRSKDMTQPEIANIVGISQVEVSRILKRVRAKIKDHDVV